jgi:hypothetical protein
MKKTTPAPLYGNRRTLDDRARIIAQTLAEHDRQIRAAQNIGRKYLDGVTLSEAGKAFARTLDAYMDAKKLDRASLAARVSAMQELAPLRFSEDCSPGDLKLVLHQGVQKEQPTAASQGSEVLAFSDGSPVSPGDREEVARLGGPSRYERLRCIAQTKGLDLSKASSRAIAEGILFSEVASTVACAKSLDEALHVFMRENPKASLREATLSVGQLRPDLRGMVGSGGGGTQRHSGVVAFDEDHADPQAAVDRAVMVECQKRGLDFDDDRERAQAQALVFSKRPDLARALFFADRTPGVRVDDTQAVAFTAKVDEVLREQHLPRTPDNVAKASNAVRRRFPHLVTVPGSGRRD